MSLQNKVNITMPPAQPGALASTEPSALRNLVPGARNVGGAKCGNFVFAATAPEGQGAGLQEQFVSAAGSSVAGFCYRVQDAVLPSTEGATLEYQPGQPVPVAISGDFYAPVYNGGSIGQKALADEETGNIYAGTSATSAANGTLSFANPASDFSDVTSGALNLSIDGGSVALSGLNFESASTASEVAAVINTALTSNGSCSVSDGAIVIASPTTGKDSNVQYVGGDLGSLLGSGVSVPGRGALVETGFELVTAANPGELAIISK